jgi:hypothetical protein
MVRRAATGWKRAGGDFNTEPLGPRGNVVRLGSKASGT